MRNFGDYVTFYDKFKEFLEQLEEFFTKTQGVFRKTEGFANWELEIIAEKRPKKPGLLLSNIKNNSTQR